MKLLGLMSVIIILFGCCKKVQVIHGISLVYQSLTETSSVVVKKYRGTEIVSIHEENTWGSENQKYLLEVVNDSAVSYIISIFESDLIGDSLIPNVLHSDTISGVSFKIKGKCQNERMKNLEYFYNGILKVDEKEVMIE